MLITDTESTRLANEVATPIILKTTGLGRLGPAVQASGPVRSWDVMSGDISAIGSVTGMYAG
jgi:hypothetical protein